MENKSHAFWAGLFTVALLLAIGAAAFFFNVDRTVRVPYDLIARTNVTGLYTDAAVRYRGLDVGKVQSIHFDRQHPGQIVIRILVDKNAPITQSTFGSLGLQGVTGIASCNSTIPARTRRRSHRRRSRSRRFPCIRGCSTSCSNAATCSCVSSNVSQPTWTTCSPKRPAGN